MPGCLLPTGNESVTLSVTVVQALEQRGDGDAALLYLALLRHQGTVPPRSLAGELRWEKARIERAETVLRELRLLAAAEPAAAPEPAEARPEYTADDITERLEHSAEFRGLTGEVERRLGKRLTTPGMAVLLGLWDDLGLPADVIYLLVCHCVEKAERHLGPGRRPGMRQIEREGYAWSRQGIDTQDAAVAYLKKYAARQEALPRYMEALRLPQRPASPSEEKYILSWQDMGFSPEAAAIAYDKTILRCQELKWPYLNGILKKWHEAGIHTVEEIEAGDRPAGGRESARPAPEGAARQDQDLSWMRKYIHQRDKHREV